MTVCGGQRSVSCSENQGGIKSMEVVESPLNLAHQQSRKADRLVSAAQYEEAMSCHAKAADLLTDAMTTTECEQARLSLELQRDSHIKQQRLIQERWKREVRREALKTRQGPPAAPAALGPQQQQPAPGPGPAPAPGDGEREYDTLLYQLQTRQGGGGGPPGRPCPGSKTSKDDKTRLEEQQTTIQDLRRMVERLLDDKQRLAADNRLLRSENLRLRSEAAELAERSEPWVLPQAGRDRDPDPDRDRDRDRGAGAPKGKEIAIPQLPPLEMPAHEDLCLDDLPPLELPEDIRNELQELLDRDKL